VALINRAYEIESFFVAGDRTDADEVGELLAAGDFLVLPRSGGGAPLGCVYVAARPDARAYLGLLSVDPDGQKRGAGRQLVEFAEEHARGLGARYMDLHVVDLRAELPEWYGRLGYALAGEVPVPTTKTERFTRPIRFLRMEKSL
jgi:GNAT superfamily N-acetyltransferase